MQASTIYAYFENIILENTMDSSDFKGSVEFTSALEFTFSS